MIRRRHRDQLHRPRWPAGKKIPLSIGRGPENPQKAACRSIALIWVTAPSASTLRRKPDSGKLSRGIRPAREPAGTSRQHHIHHRGNFRFQPLRQPSLCAYISLVQRQGDAPAAPTGWPARLPVRRGRLAPGAGEQAHPLLRFQIGDGVGDHRSGAVQLLLAAAVELAGLGNRQEHPGSGRGWGCAAPVFNFLEHSCRNYPTFQNEPSAISGDFQSFRRISPHDQIPKTAAPKILIPFYSRTGTVEQLANAVAEGATRTQAPKCGSAAPANVFRPK